MISDYDYTTINQNLLHDSHSVDITETLWRRNIIVCSLEEN